jgi:prepilin-type N-terminal cleavage/methylation domain-containing protein
MVKNLARAFTLIELLVVIAIIAILATIAYPVYTGVQERAKITKDMNNLRQIGLATQTYMNDNDGFFPGSITPALRWMSQLNPKYLSAWGVLQSPFDTRSRSELGDASTPISYGINSNVYVNNVAISADRITKPTVFILFGPAQAAGPAVTFLGTADPTLAAPGVIVLGGPSGQATSTPGGTATEGTQNNRKRINALFADLHCETMVWGLSGGTGVAFTQDAVTADDPDGELRWKPYTPYP